MVDNTCGQGGETVNGRNILRYLLRFVLDGIRSHSRLVVLKCIFMFKSNSLCKSEKLVVFFWCRQDQKGTGDTETYFFTVWRNKGT